MSWKKCSNCGADFDGSFLEDTCSACRRLDPLKAAAKVQAYAAVEAAKAQMDVAEAQQRIAAAAEVEATANAHRAELQGKADYARAVGSLDDAGLKRLHADEQSRADREASQKVVDDVAAAIACIEGKGAHTTRIDSQAGREAQAYLIREEGKVTDGVGGAYRWHNLVAAERLLVSARESLLKITHFAAAISREELEFRIGSFLPKVAPLRKEAAQAAVEDIGRNRAFGYGSILGGSILAVGILMAVTDMWWAAAGVFVLGGILGLGSVSEWGKTKAPIHYEDITREAGSGSRAGRTAWLVALAAMAAGAAIGTIGISVRSRHQAAKPKLVGDYTRGDRSLKVEPGWLVLDGKTRLPLGNADVSGEANVHFSDAVLSKGALLDDKCSGSLDRNGNKMVVTIDQSSHADCSAFAGEWLAKGGDTESTKTPAPTFDHAKLPKALMGTWSGGHKLLLTATSMTLDGNGGAENNGITWTCDTESECAFKGTALNNWYAPIKDEPCSGTVAVTDGKMIVDTKGGPACGYFKGEYTRSAEK
jgi:hypothetical protein